MALDLNDPQAKATFLTSQGYDPTKYDLDDNYNLVPKSDFVETQPAIDIAHDPVATSQLQIKPSNQSTALQAFGHSALASTFPTLGGLGAGAIGAGLAPETGGLSLLIPLAAALAGGYGTSKLQNAVLPDSAKQELSTEEQEHPVASELGGLLPSLAFFNPLKGITELPQLAKSAGKLALGRVGATELGSAELGQLANAGVNTGLNVGQNLAGQLGNGQPFNWGSLGLSTATGAIMNSPTPLGEKVFSSFGHPQTDAQPNASEGGDIVESQSAPKSQDYPTPNPISGEAPNPFQGLMQSGALPEQTAGGSLKGYPSRMDKMANYAENTNPSPEDLSRLEGEGGPSAPENPIDLMNEWMQQRNDEFQKANQERQQQQIEEASLQRAQADLETRLQEAKLSGESKPKYQEESSLEKEPTPGSVQSIRKFGLEKDKLRSINAVADGTKPVSLIPGNNIKLPQGLKSDSRGFIYRDTPEGISAYNKAKALDVAFQEGNTPKNFMRKLGESLGYTKEEIDEFHNQKYSEESNLSPKEQNNRDWALLKNAPADYRSKVADLAFKRGINLREASHIVNPDTASEVLGKYEGGTRTATVSVAKGELDTPIHEVTHGYLDDLLNSKSAGDKNLAQRALDIFGGDKAKAEEALVSKLGVEGVKRTQTDLYGTKRDKFNSWFDDFKSRWKNNLGMASDEDTLRHLSARTFHDATYGSRRELVGREKYNALVQQYKETRDEGTKVAIAKDIEGLKNADGSGMPPKEQNEPALFATDAQKILESKRPFGLDTDKNGRLPINTINAKLEKSIPKDELATLKDAGLDSAIKSFRDENGKVDVKGLTQWVKENGPKVEVRKFGDYNIDEESRKMSLLQHQLDTDGITAKYNEHGDQITGWQYNSRNVKAEDMQSPHAARMVEMEKLYNSIRNDKNDTAHWSMVSPKPESEMKGYTEIAVTKPGAEGMESPHQGRGNNFPSNTLAWVRGHMETDARTGEKTFLIHEVQSDWAQKVRQEEAKQNLRNEQEQSTSSYDRQRFLETTKDPLLAHYESLALKAAIEHARSEGATHIAMSDAETAMMTEGHDRKQRDTYYRVKIGDKEVKGREGSSTYHDLDFPELLGKPNPNNPKVELTGKVRVYPSEEKNTIAFVGKEPGGFEDLLHDIKPEQVGLDFKREVIPPSEAEIDQAKGMRQHYDQSLPNILKKLTGEEGVKESYGEHKMAMHLVDGWQAADNVLRPRKNLIFRNPDGTPKTDVTALSYPIDKIAARREAGEPFTMTGSKYSEEPNLKKEDVKEQKPDITLKPFASETDTILNKEGERAKPATDAIAAFEADRPKKYNAYDAPEKAALKGLSGNEKTTLEETLQKENETKTNLRDTLPSDKSKEAYDAIRENIKKQAEDRIANKQPVWDVDKSGKPFAREHQIDPYYYPQAIDPKVIDTIRNKPTSPEAAAYKKSFNDYALSKGQTQAQADERWASLKQSNSKQKPDLAHFRAVDVASGIGLPKDFTRPGIERNLEHYNSRYATAASFHDNIESNPKTAPLFGIKNDPWGKPFEGADKVEPLSSKEAIGAFNRITGSDYSPEHSTINAAEKVATSSTLGFLTSWHIFASTTANALSDAMPREIPSLLTHAATNIKEGYQHAFDNGLIRNKGQMLRDLFDSHSTAAERMNSLSDTISRINGHDTLGNAAKAFSQVLYEHMLRMRIPLAKAGGDSSPATQSIRMMKQVDPYWNASKDYSPDDVSKMASRLVNMLHGSTSASQPAWMLNDSIIKPFLSLMSWNVAQTNRFMRNVVTPAVHDGNYTPLIMSTLGAVLGGYAIKEGREALANKKSPIPSLSEIAASNAKDSTKIPLYAYNLMAMTSFAGLGGVLSTGAKSLFDIAYKNPQQAPIFPLDEMLTNTGKTLSNAYAALANSDSKDYPTIGAHAISDLLRENIQAARIGASWGDEAGAFGKERQQKATLNKEEGQLRRFKMAEGMPYEDESSIDESNPYYNLGRKSFQRTTDIRQAMQELPDLISRAFQESNGNMEVLKNKLQSLKTSSYPSMPSPERTPMTFWKYVQYLNETEGPEKASQRVSEYMQNNMIDKFKGEMIPSF